MNFNQKENTLFLVYQHSLKQRHIHHNGNPDREEVISLLDKEVIYQLALPKRMLDELELSAKSNDFSLKEIFNTIISIFLKNPRKFIKLN